MITKSLNKSAKNFSKNLIKFRKINNYSQHELGNICEMSQRMISYYEDNPNSISLDKLEILAKSLNVSISDLFEDENKNKNILDNIDIRWLRKIKEIKNLSDYEQRILWNHVNSIIENHKLKKQLQDLKKTSNY